jgi:hypothetical protein
MATEEMANGLPKLIDDADIGVQKEHVVPRDGTPDLKFRGALLASSGPAGRYGKDRWREYRVYRTAGGNHVFSRVGRSVYPGERDKWDAQVSPAALPCMDAPNGPTSIHWPASAAEFFGFDDMAKELYRRLDIDITESID